MKKLFCFIFGLVMVMSCGTKQPRINKIYEGGIEVVLNHLEPYTLKGGPVHLSLKNDITIDLEKEEYSGLGLKMPDFVDTDSKSNIFIVEQYREIPKEDRKKGTGSWRDPRSADSIG